MSTPSPCPDPTCWQALLDDAASGDKSPGLGEHLAACAACRQTLETLAATREEWAATAVHLAAPPYDEEPSLRRVLAELTAADACLETRGGPGWEVEQILQILDAPDAPGQLGRLGAYQVTEVIGRGATGVVLKAWEEELGRVVALKVLAPQLAADATARRRFTREAHAAAAVRDDHVVAIHAIKETKGIPYLVMEYVPGCSLQEVVDRRQALPVEALVRISLQVARGLAAAHAQGLVHRDVKPSNILLEQGLERVRLTDFGLAKALDDATVTQSNVVAGTPQYMAPEQARGEAVDHRSDLFSLGSVLYALATGQPPFGAGPILAVLRRVSEASPRPPRDLNPALPPWFAALVARLHAKRPEERWQSAAEVAELLTDYLAHLQDPVHRPLPPGVLVTPKAVRPRRSWHRWAAAAGFVLCVALGVGVAVKTGLFSADNQVSQRDVEPRGEDLGLLADGPVGEVWRSPPQGQEISSLAISPDGRRALVGPGHFVRDGKYQGFSANLAVRLYDLTTGREVQRFRGHDSAVVGVAFAPAGHGLMVDTNLRKWDLATEQPLLATLVEREGALCAAFSVDGRQLLTGSTEQVVKLWDTNTGKFIRQFRGLTDNIGAVAFSPDGRWVAAGGTGWHDGDGKYHDPQGTTLRLWDRTTAQVLHDFRGFTEVVQAVAFSPDGRHLLTGGGDALLHLWEVETGKRVRRPFTGHTTTIGCVAFSPDGRRVLSVAGDSSPVDPSVRLWDVETGQELHCFPEAHPGGGRCVVFSPDGRFALSGGIHDGTVKLWRLPPP